MFKKLNRDMENTKKNSIKLLEMKNPVGEMNNVLDGINNKLRHCRIKG